MFGNPGGERLFLFNRFGDELASGTNESSDMLLDRFKSEVSGVVRQGLSEMKKAVAMVQKDERYNILKSHMDKIESSVNVTPSFISFNDKRLVGISKGIDKSDAVNKEQLDGFITKTKRVTSLLDVSKSGVLNVKGNRRIGSVSKSIEPYDVVVHVELSELNNKLLTFQQKINKIFEEIWADIKILKQSLKGVDKLPTHISDSDAVIESPGQGISTNDHSGTSDPA